MPRSAAQSNLTLGVVALLALTVWRVVALAFDTTDLWVDEAQYWLWGQRLDWGYFSKPPMIAWLSRAVTDLAGSDAIFWIRAPGAVLHLITAGVLGLLAARLSDRRTGLWAAAIYLTAPFATLGSWQFSTDTVLLPFYATALLAFVTLTDRRSLGWALILGAAAGGGLLSKYALIYLPITAAIAALLVPRLRIAPRDAAVAGIIALAVVSPNLIWNAMNGAQTLRHTASDNAQLGAGSLEVGRGLTFFVEQFGVFGPVTFGVFLVAAVAGLFRGRRSGGGWRCWRFRRSCSWWCRPSGHKPMPTGR